MYKGAGNSIGIAIGNALVIKEQAHEIVKKQVADCAKETQRLDAAVEKAKEQIEVLLEKANEELGEDQALIFETHLAYLEDPGYIGKVYEMISEECVNAEWALEVETEHLASLFRASGGDVIAERVDDLNDVARRVTNALLDIEESEGWGALGPEAKIVLVADHLLPSELMRMDLKRVVGIVTQSGGTTTHVAIIAKSRNIPAVMGVADMLLNVKTGDVIALNAKKGVVEINPDEAVLAGYREAIAENEKNAEMLRAYIGVDAVLSNQKRILVEANIAYPEDAAIALQNGPDGVGLFRSEFLYLERTAEPSEEEQFAAYQSVARQMQGRPVIIRTMDIGGDKPVPYLNLPKENNPFLGYRAIRVCLDREELFSNQLRAILRASAFGKVLIMLPMISALEELRAAKAVIEKTKEQLRAENIAFDPKIEVGIMIETPAAVMMSDALAKEADFFSIGTNDLIQYTTAVDRMNERVAHLYSSYHPAVLREIAMTVKNAHARGIPVGVCGEAAGDAKLVPVLLGLGVDALSMNPYGIPAIKKAVCTGSIEAYEELAEQVLEMTTIEQVKKKLGEIG
ncbi:MAG: phosphoenolpyruvate--protein phosphotransferase [Synergistaceae bacterium]|nr:phosphoenolpyruvate--protein phosphotransferase [Synergistaceae bacterium]